jgi:hypothetical protein
MASITKYEGKSLTKAVFVVEECCFVNCELKDCDLFYSGGDFDMMGELKLDNCRWHFRGEAARTMGLMQRIGMMRPIPIPPTQPFQSNTGKAN